MIARSVLLLAAAGIVASSPAWLEAIAAIAFGANDFPNDLPFSPYLFAVPAAAIIALSWLYELGHRPGVPLSETGAPAGDRLAATGESHFTPRKSSVWRRLEEDFRELKDFSMTGELSATWNHASRYGESTSETWSVRGPLETGGGDKRFAALAETAGRMLLDWPGYKPTLNAATARTQNPSERWLCALRDLGINTEKNAPGEIVGSNESIIGHSHSGRIRNVVEASIKFCVQISLEEDLEQDLSQHDESLGSQILNRAGARS